MKAVYFILSVGADYDESLPMEDNGKMCEAVQLPWHLKEEKSDFWTDGDPDVIKTEKQLRNFVEDMAVGSDEGDVCLVRMSKDGVAVLDWHSGYYQPPWD